LDGPVSTPSTSSRRGPAWLLGVAIVLLALNLRVAVGSVGVVVDPLREDLGMSATVAGVLTTLPVLCFAVFGAVTSRVTRMLGLDRTAATLLVVLAVGLVTRSVVDSVPLFLVLSVLSLAASAVGNVLLPALAKEHFPDRLALVGSLYGAALMGGGAISSVVTVPVSDALGGWREGIAVWALLAVAALVPWLPVAVRDRGGAAEVGAVPPLGRLARSPLAWTCALCFGVQAAQAYAQFGWFPTILADAGLDRGTAGAMQGLLGAVGIPMTLLLPPLVARFERTGALPWSFAALTAAGWAGVLWAPTAAPWLWAVLLGLGGCTFTWVLIMFGRRTRTTEGTASLSAFGQSVGYVVAGLGPFGTGVLHDLTGTWTLPVTVLMVAAVLIGVLGTLVDRAGTLEDDLATPA
jgi:CP family cyanate transporter-like MFS transporter